MRRFLMWITVLGLLLILPGQLAFAHKPVSIGGTFSGMAITLGQLKKTQLHVTSKMLVFAEGKKAAGVPLSDVVAIKRGDGSRWTLGIYVRGNHKAVGKITVLNTEQTEAELKEYCRQGGAHLMDEGAH